MRKLRLLRRLERVRSIAKANAMGEVARAESTLSQLEALSQRTEILANDYAARRDAGDGGDLRRLGGFVSSLHALKTSTQADVERARREADHRQNELLLAEQARAVVEERASELARFLTAQAQPAVLCGRKASGTKLD